MICSICGANKPEEQFRWRDKKHGKRRIECAACSRRKEHNYNEDKLRVLEEKWNLRERGLKKCKTCLEVKPLSKFTFTHSRYKPSCKTCCNKNTKYKLSKKSWYEKQMKSNPKFALDKKISTLIRIDLFYKTGVGKNNKHWEEMVGYTLQNLKEHLESQFKPGMGWHNHGKWHIDHIIPRSLWQYENSRDREFKQCWALANLQPLWAKENIQKSNKVGSR